MRLLTLPVFIRRFCPVFSRAQLKPEATAKADKIVIEKSARKMTLYHNGVELKTSRSR